MARTHSIHGGKSDRRKQKDRGARIAVAPWSRRLYLLRQMQHAATTGSRQAATPPARTAIIWAITSVRRETGMPAASPCIAAHANDGQGRDADRYDAETRRQFKQIFPSLPQPRPAMAPAGPTADYDRNKCQRFQRSGHLGDPPRPHRHLARRCEDDVARSGNDAGACHFPESFWQSTRLHA